VILTAYGLQQMLMMATTMMKSVWLLLLTFIASAATETAGNRSEVSRRKY